MSDHSVPYRASRWPARLLFATGLCHNIVGLLAEGVRKPLFDAIKAGYVAQFRVNYPRLHSFWFFVAGFNMMLMGRMINMHLFPNDKSLMAKNEQAHSSTKSNRKLPRELGVWFIAIAIGGAAALPKSGFYLMGLQGIALLVSE
ncbi:hypothetical protein B0O80DRAFT_453214 [Mortierella sp. GBAus27b]|nr:hypothetical protein BGX31_007347 [Mortierella sp. GBA43]KAI8353171.1 hypothetical protein B0O80DRAFT_453214 [Mortierella sp. GBAus27b]